MKSKVAKTVLDMGYDPRLVRAVMRRRIESSQTPFQNAQDLLESIFENEGNIDLDEEPSDDDRAEEAPASSDDTVGKLTKDLQNVRLGERPPGDGASNKGSEGVGELSSSVYGGMRHTSLIK